MSLQILASQRQRGLVGALICICANTLISFALNVQKLAHVRAAARDGEGGGGDAEAGRRDANANGQQEHNHNHDEGSPSSSDGSGNGNGPNTRFLRSGLWWLGMSMMVLGEGGNFVSYGFAPASLVAPLGSVALLANVFIAPLLLKEKFAKSDLLGVLLASLGAAGVVAATSTTNGGGGGGGGGNDGPDALWDALRERDFVIYGSVMAGVGCVLAYASATHWGDRYLLIDVGACAVFGGFTVLSTKGISSMLSLGTSTSDLISALKSPLSYGLVLTLVATALIQLTFLNRALQRFDARTVIPSQFVFFTISAISGSAVLFRDFERATAGSIAGFFAGCATTFAGVWVLTRRGGAEGKGGNEDEGGRGEFGGGVRARQRDASPAKPQSRSTPHLPVDGVDSHHDHRSLSNDRHRRRRRAPDERTALLTPAPRNRRPAAPIATLTTGSVPTSSDAQFARAASSSLPSAPLRTTTTTTTTGAAAPRPVMRTPRLSLVGGTALGAGGYLLLATPGRSGGGSTAAMTATMSADHHQGRRRGGSLLRALSVSPSPRGAAVPQRGRDITLGVEAVQGGGDDGGEEDGEEEVDRSGRAVDHSGSHRDDGDDDGDGDVDHSGSPRDYDELSLSVSRALAAGREAVPPQQQPRRPQRRLRNRSSELSLGRSGSRRARE